MLKKYNRQQNLKEDKKSSVEVQDLMRQNKEKELNWQWIPDNKFVWIPSRFVQQDGQYMTADKKSINPTPAEIKKAISLNRFLLLNSTHNLLSIIEGRNEAYVMYVLATRYYKGKIYTKLGSRVLISLNPYRTLPIFTEKVAEMYKKDEQNLLPPHVFQLAKEAMESLVNNKKSQSIIIVGESGAGKTETSKQIFKVKFFNNG